MSFGLESNARKRCAKEVMSSCRDIEASNVMKCRHEIVQLPSFVCAGMLHPSLFLCLSLRWLSFLTTSEPIGLAVAFGVPPLLR